MHLGLSPAQWFVCVAIVALLLASGGQDPQRLFAASLPQPVALPLLPVEGMRVSNPEVQSPLDQLSATSVYVLTQENGEVLLEHNSNTDYAPASTTKLMTALVARQSYPLDQVITIPPVSFADPHQPLRPGQQYTVRELLSALLITSNNTAAYALAQAHPQGFAGFVEQMNTTAHTLDLTNTYFANPAGFDDASHRSTARDLGLLFRASLRDPVLAQLLSTQTTPLHNADGGVVSTLVTTHRLLGSDPRVVAGKTGTTDEARQVLITLLHTNNHPYIIVLLGSEDRYRETSRLADWVDRRYTWQIMDPATVLQQASSKQP